MEYFAYIAFFASALTVSTIIAIILFIAKAKTARRAKPEEIPYLKLGKILIIASILLIIALTPISIDMVGDKRNPSPDDVVYNGVTATEGFRVSMDYNCMGCHTVVGNGAYFAPDLTYIARRAWTPGRIRALLDAYTGSVWMPFNLTDREKDALTAWLLYLRDLNTNGWPPMPSIEIVVGQAAQTTTEENETIKLGRQIYETRCASCHGVDGKGVVPGAPDFTNATWWEAELAKEGLKGLVEIVKNGRGAMPPFAGVLSDDEIRAVLAYGMSLAAKPAEKKIVVGGYSFAPTFEENTVRWYESRGAWYVYWIITVVISTVLIYSFLYWHEWG
ncbi:MAG: c-type cytochrome [Desulfurococcales archaeon]|nr:c-type cytochrome [Desulfurococcales archaeon]